MRNTKSRKATDKGTELRRTKELDGEWMFLIDPDDRGEAEAWYKPDVNWPERTNNVQVPHVWQEQEKHNDYTGVAWYRRSFSTDLPSNSAAILKFGAIDYHTHVWVNGVQVGSNQGGYLPFEFDITDALVSGTNTIALRVEDPKNIDEIPHGKQGNPWYTRVSGIWQSVCIEIRPEWHITNAYATPNLEDDSVNISFTSTDLSEVESLAVEDLSATVSIQLDDEGLVSETLDIEPNDTHETKLELEDPTYWTPETPTLYDIEIRLDQHGHTVDRYEDYFGMRSIETNAESLLLNGEPYYIRGALDQGYYPRTLYRPPKPDFFEQEIRTAKNLGFNLLRKHIKPPHPEFLELADRLGILVWTEPANPTTYTDRSKREVREQIYGMIRRDYNHPSFAILSLYNEEWGIGNPQGVSDESSLWDDESKQTYLDNLFQDVKQYDPTRVICDNSGWAHVATDINDYHEYFVSPDRSEAWEKALEEIAADPGANYGPSKNNANSTPILVSEFGAWGLPLLPLSEGIEDDSPPWFNHEFLDSPLKSPGNPRKRFQNSRLSSAFDDWSALATAWQQREYKSNKDVIEKMRGKSDIAGYVITQFTDVEWEFNGILNYDRSQKEFHEDFISVNDDLMVSINVEDHVVSSDGTVEADLILSNHTNHLVRGDVNWSLFDQCGTVSVEQDGHGVEHISGAISVDAPRTEQLKIGDLTVSMEGAPENSERIFIVSEPSVPSDICVYTDDDHVEQMLTVLGAEVVDDLAAMPEIAILTKPDDIARTYAKKGGIVLYLPTREGYMAENEFFEYHELPEKESWNLVSSIYYANSEPFTSYLESVPGWELEHLHPYHLVDDLGPTDEVGIGYVEGWLANERAVSLTRELEDGVVSACTLRLTEGNEQPMSQTLLAAMIKEFCASRGGASSVR